MVYLWTTPEAITSRERSNRDGKSNAQRNAPNKMLKNERKHDHKFKVYLHNSNRMKN